MIREDNMALLSAESANEITFLFNAFNSMVGLNGASVIHGESGAKIILGDANQAANPIPRVEPIKAGASDTYLSSERLNVLISAYNKIMSFRGDGIIEPKMNEGAIVIDVKL